METFHHVFTCNYIKQDAVLKNICVPAILGAISSIWTCAIFITSITRETRTFQYFFLDTIKYTHFILIICITVGYIYGLMKNKRHFLLPWVQLKLCEFVLICVSLVIITTLNGYYYFNMFLLHTILGPINAALNLWLIWFVWTRFKSMPNSQSEYDEAQSVNNQEIRPTEKNIDII